MLRKILASSVMLLAFAGPVSTASAHHHKHRHHHKRSVAIAYPVMGVQDTSAGDCVAGRLSYAAAGATLNDPAFTNLHAKLVRYSPEWDVALPHDLSTRSGRRLEMEQLCLDAWLVNAAAHHQTVELSLRPDINDTQISLSLYRQAMQAIVSDYTTCNPCMPQSAPAGWPAPPAAPMARVSVYASWGEPNFGATGQTPVMYLPSGAPLSDANCPAAPTVDNCGPYLAAAMWVTVHQLCPRCINLAGDYSSNGGYNHDGARLSYLQMEAQAFKRFGYHPRVWAIHPYVDTQVYEESILRHQHLPTANQTLTARWLHSLWKLGYRSSTQVWLDEISVFQISIFHQIHFTPAMQARAMRWLINILPTAGRKHEPRITTEVYFSYASSASFPNWSLRVGNILQPAYYTFVHRPHAPKHHRKHHRKHRRHR